MNVKSLSLVVALSLSLSVGCESLTQGVSAVTDTLKSANAALAVAVGNKPASEQQKATARKNLANAKVDIDSADNKKIKSIIKDINLLNAQNEAAKSGSEKYNNKVISYLGKISKIKTNDIGLNIHGDLEVFDTPQYVVFFEGLKDFSYSTFDNVALSWKVGQQINVKGFIRVNDSHPSDILLEIVDY